MSPLPVDEYRAILQDAREHVLYLNELGVQNLETELTSANVGNSKPAPKSRNAGAEIPPPMAAFTTKPTSRVETPVIDNSSSKTSKAAANLLFHDIAAAPPTLEKSGETWAQIHAEIGDCTRCPLYEQRTHIVHTEGNHRARLMFVGEAPGADEDAQARPFVGRAGQLLTKMIEGIGFKREEVLIGNVNRCRPPGNRAPTEQEASTCKPFLLREIAVVQPEVIVVMGNTATQNLIGTKIGITRLRGEFQDYHGVKVMPTFHPAYLLRDPSKKQETWHDLKKVRDYLKASKKREE